MMQVKGTNVHRSVAVGEKVGQARGCDFFRRLDYQLKTFNETVNWSQMIEMKDIAGNERPILGQPKCMTMHFAFWQLCNVNLVNVTFKHLYTP